MALALEVEDFKNILKSMLHKFQENKDYLNELDTKIGDGDHGLSMVRGFQAVEKFINSQDFPDVKTLFMQAGMQFNEAAGSTIGILIFSAMMEAGKTSARFESIGLKELCEMLAAAIEGIEKRGKVEPGQKTIVDSLVSAHREFERLLDEGNTDPSEVTQPVLEAAEEGAEQTKEMKSAIGRARWFADRSIGVVDPGAVSGKLIIETFAEYITQQ